MQITEHFNYNVSKIIYYFLMKMKMSCVLFFCIQFVFMSVISENVIYINILYIK